MIKYLVLLFLFKFLNPAFVNPLINANFSQGLNGWYTETKKQLEEVEGTSGTKAIKMTRANTTQPCPFISQWPKWPINQKFTLGMRYKIKINEGGKILLSCEGSKYLDTIYLYTDTIDTNDKWVIQELDTKWTEFIEGKGLCSIQFRGSTVGTFILDEVFWRPAKVNIFTSLSINVWQSTVYEEEFEIRVALKIKDTIYENGEYLKLNLTIYDKSNNNQKLFIDKYEIKRTHLTKYAQFIVDPSKLQPGYYYAKVQIYNNYVDVYETNQQCFFRKSGEGFTREYLKKNRKIYIDDKLRTWINGKMTFPIGLYAGEYNTTHRDNWVNSPFNIVFNGGSSLNMIQELYSLSNHRLYSLQYLGRNSATTSQKEEDILKARENGLNVVKKNKDYEGLLGYYFIDEPGISITNSMMNTTFAIREADPTHFVFTAVNQRYNLNIIKEGLDVIGTDCYPATTSDSLHCVSTVAIEGIRNMANAKANWGVIQIYDKTVDGESGQNAPTELEIKNMLYQVIAAGAMGLFAYDYASLWHPKAHNSPQPEWEKAVKIFTEFRDVYSKFVYVVDEPFRESYKFPEMIYSIPRGENVIARLWKNGKYDYILLVNMDRKKDVVPYKFTKPSIKTCIEIMSGVNETDIVQNNENSIVTVNMPKIGVVWLRGYDTDSVCDKVTRIDPATIQIIIEPNKSSSFILGIVLIIIFVIIVSIVLFLFFTKKLCFAADFNFKNSLKDIKSIELLKK